MITRVFGKNIPYSALNEVTPYEVYIMNILRMTIRPNSYELIHTLCSINFYVKYKVCNLMDRIC